MLTSGRWQTSREEYHADTTADSHSSLEVFRKSVPLYHAVFVSGELAAPGPSPAQEFGTAVHSFILEPGKFNQDVVVQPEKWDLRTNKGKEAQAACLTTARGRALITPDQYEQVQRMAESVRKNKAARELLDLPGEVEQAVRWTCPETGLQLRAMLDKMVESGPTVDLKTAIDPTPEGWAKACANFGYHRQCALYLDGRQHACRVEWHQFFFITVGKEPPYETVVYQLDERAEHLGRTQNIALLQELRDCKDFDRWSSRHGDEVVPLSLPRWAFYS